MPHVSTQDDEPTVLKCPVCSEALLVSDSHRPYCKKCGRDAAMMLVHQRHVIPASGALISCTECLGTLVMTDGLRPYCTECKAYQDERRTVPPFSDDASTE